MRLEILLIVLGASSSMAAIFGDGLAVRMAVYSLGVIIPFLSLRLQSQRFDIEWLTRFGIKYSTYLKTQERKNVR